MVDKSFKTGGSTETDQTDLCDEHSDNNCGWIMIVAKKEKKKDRSIDRIEPPTKK
jgi:hypothetical protein